ncbi:MAG: hypothetical protein C4320_05970, partial [Armatimonadota bacterium]
MGRVQIERAEVLLTGLLTPPGLRIARFHISGEGLRPGSKGLEGEAPLPFRATLTAEGLTDFLSTKRLGGLEDARIKFLDERLVLDATKRILIKVPIHIECVLNIREERFLELNLREAKALGAGIRNLAEGLVEKANPLLDAADLPVP